MPYPLKIQPIDFNVPPELSQSKLEAAVKPVLKSRFMRLFERQFLRVSVPGKPAAGAEPQNCNKNDVEVSELSSVCLAKMVENFIEGTNEKHQLKSEEEPGSNDSSLTDALRTLVPCLCVSERNLLADTAKIIHKNKINRRKDGFCRKIVVGGLIALGYDASICKSKWEKSPSFPAGEYEYVDVIIEGERLIIDIDFRSEFEIARPTKAYRMVLQTLPSIFIGKPDRLEKIVDIVSEAAKKSLKKRGMHVPPWRKAGYVKAKWLSRFSRISGSSPNPTSLISISSIDVKAVRKLEPLVFKKASFDSDFELIFKERSSSGDSFGVFALSDSCSSNEAGVCAKKCGPLPEIKPRSSISGARTVTGLASLIADDKP